MKRICIFFLLLSVWGMSCEKAEGFIDMRYFTTQCNDPWGAPPETDEELLVLVLDHLDKKGIDVQEAEVVPGQPYIVNCGGCDCPANQAVNVVVPAAKQRKMERIGFLTY